MKINDQDILRQNQNHLEQIITLCERLNLKNMLAAADGNISFRTDEGHIIITATGLNKAFMNPSDFSVVNSKGDVLFGSPSTELAMHLEVFNLCSLARAVVHAHPPSAIAWSIAFPEQRELPTDSISEVILGIGEIPIVPYARPGTKEMALQFKNYFPRLRTAILARHGAIAWGESLIEAYNGIERIEHAALVMTKAHSLGGAKPLASDEIEWLKSKRKSSDQKNR